MAVPSLSAFFSQRKPLPLHRVYWRAVPVRRLSALLLAIFFLFGMIGCFVDLLDHGQKPFVPVIVWSAFSGLLAVVWIVAFFRDRRWLIGAVILWIAGSALLSNLLRHLGPYSRPTSEYGTRAVTIACIVLSFLAYCCFMNFIQREGSLAVRMQTELALAQGIQKTLVPPIEWLSDRIEVYGISIPSAEVGGDLVDVAPLSDGSVFAYLADVSGHGLPAGILMGMIKTAVRTQLVDLPTPPAVLQRLNEVLPSVKEPHMYATCAALRIIPGAKDACQVEYAIAAHPAVLHVSAGGTVSRLEDQQLPLGLIAGASYVSHRVSLQSGEILLVATDGILEATNKSGAEYGLDRLQQILSNNRTQALAVIFERIRTDLNSSYAQDDDQSLLLVRFSPAKSQQS
jgi:sigma-B regulation protein RsbU (phosphoserine phosphatase)